MEDFRAVYDRQADRVYRLCMLYLKNDSDARDGVQDIFLKLLEKNISFESAVHEQAWFIRTTKNYCIDKLKSFWRRKRADWNEWSGQAGNEPQEEGVLLEMVMKLPMKYREVLYLYYYEEYSVREIGNMLGRKESTIQSQLAAGRKKLRQQLEVLQK